MGNQTTRRRALGTLATMAIAPLALTACGGGSSRHARLRFVNATLDFGDLTAHSDSTQLASLPIGAATSFIEIDDSSQTLRIKADGTTLLEQGFNPDTDTTWSALVYANAGSLRLSLYEEAEGAPAGGECKFRVFNAGESGPLDVFLTAGDISLVSPVAAAVAPAQFSGYAVTASGSRRLRITSAGDRSDLRLDIAAFDLPSAGVVTLVVLPTRSAKLLQAVALVHGSAALALNNPYGRLRFVNGLGVSATPQVDGAAVLDTLAAAGVSTNANVATGAHSVGFDVGGTATAQSRNVAAATDASCIAHGDSAAPQIAFIDDDNRAPTTPSSVRLRLANFASGVASATLTVDLSAEGLTAAAATASAYTQVAAATHRLDVIASSGASLGTLPSQDLLAGGVYTLFVLGSAVAPQLVLRRDR